MYDTVALASKEPLLLLKPFLV
uniref:Uncharacterized protein n=1 Tax=Rhizophora mucronata TaxID=61149 RepID=A0A2P2PWZ7_RHIMU